MVGGHELERTQTYLAQHRIGGSENRIRKHLDLHPPVGLATDGLGHLR